MKRYLLVIPIVLGLTGVAFSQMPEAKAPDKPYYLTDPAPAHQTEAVEGTEPSPAPTVVEAPKSVPKPAPKVEKAAESTTYLEYIEELKTRIPYEELDCFVRILRNKDIHYGQLPLREVQNEYDYAISKYGTTCKAWMQIVHLRYRRENGY